MNKKDIPSSLREFHSEKRLETINKVQEAINQIKEDNGIVTKKKLMELTGYSSATFSKKHVIQVLKDNQVCQFKESKRVKINNKISQEEQFYKRIEKLINEKSKLESKLQDKEIAVYKLRTKNNELENNYKMILGKLHLVIKRIDQQGIDIGIDLDKL